MTDMVTRRPRWISIAATVGAAASFGASGLVIGASLNEVSGNRMAPWIIGRAAGICAYVLLVIVVLLGLVLSHPGRARSGGSSARRIRVHIALALFTFAFTALHVAVLVSDKWAGVGWQGALLPLGATYRPLPVTLGLFGLWTGLLVGTTATLAGRLPRRLWWPLHKVAGLALTLVWLHGVLAGGDTPALLGGYIATGALVLAVALWRYNAHRIEAAAR